MNLSDITEIAAAKWREYDAIQASTSDAWEQMLQAKLDMAANQKKYKISHLGLVLLLLALLNIGVVVFSTSKKTKTTISRDAEFKTLSHELLLTVNN